MYPYAHIRSPRFRFRRLSVIAWWLREGIRRRGEKDARSFEIRVIRVQTMIDVASFTKHVRYVRRYIWYWHAGIVYSKHVVNLWKWLIIIMFYGILYNIYNNMMISDCIVRLMTSSPSWRKINFVLYDRFIDAKEKKKKGKW